MSITNDISTLDADDIEKINALKVVIIAKVLDEVAPNSDQMTTGQIALGALACRAAAAHLQPHALFPVDPVEGE